MTRRLTNPYGSPRAVALHLLLFAGLLACSGGTAAAAPPTTTSPLSSLNSALQALSDRVGPAVVKIEIIGALDVAKAAAVPGVLPTRQRTTGSGVIVDPRGYIVTNHHVVTGAQRVNVVLGERDAAATSILKPHVRTPARIVGTDRETDLAVLKIDGSAYPHLQFTDSDRIQQGQIVLAFGSPHGLRNSVSMGVISAHARQLKPDHPVVFIQSDVAINPGNSGGPLVDVRGQLIGINSMILSQSGESNGLSFAVPSNIVHHVYQQIVTHGRVRRGLIGVNAQTIDHYLATGLGLATQTGVIISDVNPRGPAAAAGVRHGDIVLRLDGKRMENGRQFDVNVYRKPIGDTVTLEILREASKRTIRVRVAERVDSAERIADSISRSAKQVRSLGVLAVDLSTYGDLKHLPLRIRAGVMVVGVAKHSPSVGTPLAPGDIIHRVNRTEVKNLNGLRLALSGLEGATVLQVERRGRLHLLSFDL